MENIDKTTVHSLNSKVIPGTPHKVCRFKEEPYVPWKMTPEEKFDVVGRCPDRASFDKMCAEKMAKL